MLKLPIKCFLCYFDVETKDHRDNEETTETHRETTKHSFGWVFTIHTGGTQRQVYLQVYAEFAQNKHIYLFDRAPSMLRPAISCYCKIIQNFEEFRVNAFT